MTWNYRLFEITVEGFDPEFQIVECFYDDDGNVTGWSDVHMIIDAPADTAEFFERIQKDIERNPTPLVGE